MKNFKNKNNDNNCKTILIDKLDGVYEQRIEVINQLNNQEILQPLANTNMQKFLKFLNTKEFENIYDIQLDDPILNTLIYDRISSNKFINNKGVIEVKGWDSHKNVLNIFKNIKYEEILRYYKDLQHYNTIGVCSYLTLAPLFLSVYDRDSGHALNKAAPLVSVLHLEAFTLERIHR